MDRYRYADRAGFTLTGTFKQSTYLSYRTLAVEISSSATQRVTSQLRLTPQTTCRARFIPWRGGARRLR